MKNQICFGLWAEDINRYLGTGYNKATIAEVKRALIDYVSVDSDNPPNIDKTPLTSLLGMTGLELDYLTSPFTTKSESDETPTSIRVGFKVDFSSIKKMEKVMNDIDMK